MEQMIIKGFIGKKIFGSEDYKIYSFYPDTECANKVKLNQYGNITICGCLPDMIEEKSYILEVKYVKKGNYDNYVVNKILNKKEKVQLDESIVFLNTFWSARIVKNILKAYPDIINMILNNRSHEIDISKIHGVGEKKFKKLQNSVVKHYQLFEIINEFHEYDLTFSQVVKIYDRFTSIEVLRQKMHDNPYQCLCSIGGIGFKTADAKILNKNESLRTSPFRMKECMFFVLKENELSGNTWVHIREFHEKCYEIASEAMSHFMSIVKDNERIYFDKETKKVALLKTYLCEKDIAKKIKSLLDSSKNSNFSYQKYDNVDGVPLTDKQMKILQYASKYGVSILSGYGGTGKSFSTKALITMLEDEHQSYILLSPTGKASKVLSAYTNRTVKTIHRGLGYKPTEGFSYRKENPLKVDFVIIDEGSMIDVFLMRDLLNAIEDGTKVIFICDPAQIASVGCGNCMQDLIESKKVPNIFLDEVFRYGEGGLSYVATKIRKGEKFLDEESGLQVFGKDKDFSYIPSDNENMLERMMTLYKAMISKGINKNDIMIISAYNKGEFGTYNINKMIQSYINPKLLDSEIELKYIRDKAEIVFRLGDKVMQTKNNYSAKLYEKDSPFGVTELDRNGIFGDDEEDEEFFDINGEETVGFFDIDQEEATTSVFNGDEGTVVKITKNGLVVDFYGTLVEYTQSEIKDLLLAYAISAHKSQGSSFTHVIVVTPTSHKFFLNRNLLYVAFSRARLKAYNVGLIDTIHGSLRKSENTSRKTFLQDMLTDGLEE